MANIEITDQGGGSLSDGILQIANGVPLDGTLRNVADQNNTNSPLKLSTTLVQTTSTLQITTQDNPYIDAEDGFGNNRFTIGRISNSQQVNVDFASNPTLSTTIVGGIRTYKDGVNLSTLMVFSKEGNVGIGQTTAPSGLLHVDGGANVPRIILDADTNVARIFSFRTNDLPRWALRVDGNETGTNAGSDFSIRRYNDTGTFVDAPLSINRANGRVSVNERLLVESDSTVATQTSSVIQSSTTNANLVIAPNGTGALIADIPDGTATGGNARGQYAVDLQMIRSNAIQVAAGDYSIVIGSNNRSVSSYATAIGYNNTAQGFFGTAIGVGNSTGDTSAVAIGESNSAGAENSVSLGKLNICNAKWATITGGLSNNQGSQYGVISGGQSNTASTGTHATVVGGQSNTASGQWAVVSGYNNTSSGNSAFAGGREGTVSSAQASFAFGRSCNASQKNSIATGEGANAYLFAMKTHSGVGGFVFNGECQNSELIACRSQTLTTAATTVLSLDGSGTTNLIIPNGNNRAWNVTIKYVATVTLITGTATGVTVGDTKSQNIEIGFKRVGGTSSLVGAGSYSIAQEDASMNTATLVPTAGGSQELALTFTAPTFAGGGSVTCRVVAKVELTEVAW